ncbi:MAG: 4-(cytidine 5'-diphospho)-2-C-methyl-D-erythritol kinase [Acidimicrobiales bacterium]
MAELTLEAPAKLTLSLRIVGTRSDGYHLLESEMVSVSLADTLSFDAGTGLEIVDEVPGGLGTGGLGAGAENLVSLALDAVGRRARVTLHKCIPPGAGLGGGSADAAAVLRWAGCHDLDLAARLGADVPFCIVGGRAAVRGIGEQIEALPYEARRYLLLLPPLRVDTADAYAAWDAGHRSRGDAGNDLEAAALVVEPRLARWRDAFAAASGLRPRLAGSGAGWFVELADGDGVAEVGPSLVVDGVRAPVVPVAAVPAFGP